MSTGAATSSDSSPLGFPTVIVFLKVPICPSCHEVGFQRQRALFGFVLDDSYLVNPVLSVGRLVGTGYESVCRQAGKEGGRADFRLPTTLGSRRFAAGYGVLSSSNWGCPSAWLRCCLTRCISVAARKPAEK